jgi:hypothetical protein
VAVHRSRLPPRADSFSPVLKVLTGRGLELQVCKRVVVNDRLEPSFGLKRCLVPAMPSQIREVGFKRGTHGRAREAANA